MSIFSELKYQIGTKIWGKSGEDYLQFYTADEVLPEGYFGVPDIEMSYGTAKAANSSEFWTIVGVASLVAFVAVYMRGQ